MAGGGTKRAEMPSVAIGFLPSTKVVTTVSCKIVDKISACEKTKAQPFVCHAYFHIELESVHVSRSTAGHKNFAWFVYIHIYTLYVYMNMHTCVYVYTYGGVSFVAVP